MSNGMPSGLRNKERGVTGVASFSLEFDHHRISALVFLRSSLLGSACCCHIPERMQNFDSTPGGEQKSTFTSSLHIWNMLRPATKAASC